MAPAAAFSVVVGCVAIAIGLTVLSLIVLVASAALAFTSGYLYRADIAATGRKPWPKWLTVEGDDRRS